MTNYLEIHDTTPYLTSEHYIAFDLWVYNLKDYNVLKKGEEDKRLKMNGNSIVFADLIYAIHDGSDTIMVAPRKILETDNDINEIYSAKNPSREELIKLIEEDELDSKKWIKGAIFEGKFSESYDFYLKVEI